METCTKEQLQKIDELNAVQIKRMQFLKKALTFNEQNCGLECDEKEGCLPALIVSKTPKIVRLMNGSYKLSKSFKKKPVVNSIEDVCKYICSLRGGAVDKLRSGAIKCGVTRCECPGRRDKRVEFIQRFQANIDSVMVCV